MFMEKITNKKILINCVLGILYAMLILPMAYSMYHLVNVCDDFPLVVMH